PRVYLTLLVGRRTPLRAVAHRRRRRRDRESDVAQPVDEALVPLLPLLLEPVEVVDGEAPVPVHGNAQALAASVLPGSAASERLERVARRGPRPSEADLLQDARHRSRDVALLEPGPGGGADGVPEGVAPRIVAADHELPGDGIGPDGERPGAAGVR